MATTTPRGLHHARRIRRWLIGFLAVCVLISLVGIGKRAVDARHAQEATRQATCAGAMKVMVARYPSLVPGHMTRADMCVDLRALAGSEP